MGRDSAGNWADRAAELGGASAMAIGCGISAWLLRAFVAVPGSVLAASAMIVGGLCGWLFVRHAGPSRHAGSLPDFALEPVRLDLVGDDDALLLDELLLDEPLVTSPASNADPATPSRVVSLFGGTGTVPTAGELQRRIERHLDSGSPGPQGSPTLVPDASDALFEALADLRRSLRQG